MLQPCGATNPTLQPERHIHGRHEFLASDLSFSPIDRASIRAAFIQHMVRFMRQDRETDWRRAPADFAKTYCDDDIETTVTTARLFRREMEALLDDRVIEIDQKTGLLQLA